MGEAMRVLLVDDRRDTAVDVAAGLEEADESLTVDIVTSASEGLDRLAADRIDCIVSDYDLAGMDGLAFLEAVREDDPDLPFILFTAADSEQVASDAISAGVTDYLQRGLGQLREPILANRIRNAVEQHRAQQRLAGREKAVARQNQRLRALFEQFPEPTITYVYEDGDPYVVDVNEVFTEVFGYTAAEAVGEHVDDLVVPPDREDEAQRIDERVKKGEQLDEVVRRQTSDGLRDFWFRNIRLPEDEQIDGYAVYADITERKG
jgi:PAS domain S-box-containing protein